MRALGNPVKYRYLVFIRKPTLYLTIVFFQQNLWRVCEIRCRSIELSKYSSLLDVKIPTCRVHHCFALPRRSALPLKFIVSTPSPVCGLVSHKREQSAQTISISWVGDGGEGKQSALKWLPCHRFMIGTPLGSNERPTPHAYANLGSRVGAQYPTWELMNNPLKPPSHLQHQDLRIISISWMLERLQNSLDQWHNINYLCV